MISNANLPHIFCKIPTNLVRSIILPSQIGIFGHIRTSQSYLGFNNLQPIINHLISFIRWAMSRNTITYVVSLCIYLKNFMYLSGVKLSLEEGIVHTTRRWKLEEGGYKARRFYFVYIELATQLFRL